MDTFPETFEELGEFEFRITLRTDDELRVIARIEGKKLIGIAIERNDACLIGQNHVDVAFDKILEARVPRELVSLAAGKALSLSVALWEGGLPVDLLPSEGSLSVKMGDEAFAWPEN